MFQGVAVVERDLIAFLDIFQSNEPDLSVHVLSFAIRRTRVVCEPGDVPFEISVDIGFLVQFEDVDGANVFDEGAIVLVVRSGGRDLFLNQFAQVLDDVFFLRYVLGGEEAVVVDR